MRIQQLDLIRYGKFTDQRLHFPRAARDFHLVVGANEAGKSTTQSAILDLLFGIELRSSFDFLHAKAELRLGACIEQDGASLAFVRSKARVRSLLDAATAQALPDAALSPFLAGIDRHFFSQMFGLDHARLVAGGKDILNASGDIGQVLFQSAAGIGSLGAVREQLDAEADKLWARRRAGDRAYYIASDELALADAALKAATVRTKDWMEARDKVLALEARRAQATGAFRTLEAQRLQLERLRRVAPALRQLRIAQAEQSVLAAVVLLPPDAAQHMSEAELALASAAREQALYAEQARATGDRLAAVHVDARLLQHAGDIAGLVERRSQVGQHRREIERDELALAQLQQRTHALLDQLGWETSTLALPSAAARAELAGLAQRRGLLAQTQDSAQADWREKRAELAAVDAQLAGLIVSQVPAALRAALAQARGLGDVQAALRRDEALVATQRRQLTDALAAHPWPVNSQQASPTPQQIHERLQREAEAQMAGQALREAQQQLLAGIRAQQLSVSQYRKANHPVSLADLTAARAERDTLWQTLKSGPTAVSALATDFEAKLVHADAVADQRHDKAREQSELQAKLDALERSEQQAQDHAERVAAQDAQAAALRADWARLSAELGLGGLALQDVESWRAGRERVAAATALLADSEQALQLCQNAAQAAQLALCDALGEPSTGSDLATLILKAADAVDAATAAKARLEELQRQRLASAAALSRSQEKTERAQADSEAWQVAWARAAAALNLPPAVTLAAAESALGAMAELDEALKAMQTLRDTRIRTMRRELDDFEQDLRRVLAVVAPDLDGAAPAAAALELKLRLEQMQQRQRDAERLAEELAAQTGQAAAAGLRLAQAQGRLQPLLQLAQAGTLEDLRAKIGQSDQRRQIDAGILQAQHALAEGGDGLGVDQLEAELGAVDALQIPLQMAEIARQLEALLAEQTALTAALTEASAELAKIAGQDAAARAESERQDALAKMANAAERYIKVYTAARLLKWAVDRYRETKQGPMLTRAGEIFAALTLGSFQKLVLDFDSEPLTLHGLRAGAGGLVPITGMSDGTRDQLYLALRLAALELHLGSGGQALPFIADDLFINYDDGRAQAGLEALARLSQQTQVIFLSHHEHLVPTVRRVFGAAVNIVAL